MKALALFHTVKPRQTFVPRNVKPKSPLHRKAHPLMRSAVTEAKNVGFRAVFEASRINPATIFAPKSFASAMLAPSGLKKLASSKIVVFSTLPLLHQKRYFAEQKEGQAQEQATNDQQSNNQQQKENEANKTDPSQVRIKELEEAVNLLKSKLQYTYADMQNISRIAKLDVEKANKYGIQSFAKALLGVSDNLARCLSHVKPNQSEEYKMLVEGVKMVEKDLLKVFGNFGVAKFNPMGEKFDPNRMNALTQFEDPNKEAGTVGIVMNEGYMFHDRVLRAADVGVVKGK